MNSHCASGTLGDDRGGVAMSRLETSDGCAGVELLPFIMEPNARSDSFWGCTWRLLMPGKAWMDVMKWILVVLIGGVTPVQTDLQFDKLSDCLSAEEQLRNTYADA